MAFSDRQGEVPGNQLRARDKNPTIELDGSENDENGDARKSTVGFVVFCE
jgi:hypothetical protein